MKNKIHGFPQHEAIILLVEYSKRSPNDFVNSTCANPYYRQFVLILIHLFLNSALRAKNLEQVLPYLWDYK